MNDYTRRRFLKLGAQTLAGAGLALGADPMLTLVQAAEANVNVDADYRALVCVYLEGGQDGFSLLVPTSTAEYNEYSGTRQDLSVDLGSLQAINAPSSNVSSLGMHTAAGPLMDLYSEQRLALVANVGNIVVPTTVEEYENKLVTLPEQLFSHSDQEIQWLQQQGKGPGEEGWGALASSRLSAYQERDYLTAITVGGANYWQSGAGQRPFSLKHSGLVDYAGLDLNDDWEGPRAHAMHNVANKQYSNVFQQAYADIENRARKITTELGEALEKTSSIVPQATPTNMLAAQLGMVAKLIAVRQQLGMRRQIFYVRMKGFDVHDFQNRDQPLLWAELAEALSFFQGAIDTMGESSNVTTFTVSDFGRTLTSNGDGTDHGWGNHLMVMGDAVKGGDVYGTIPRMGAEGPDAIKSGRIVPTTASSQYASTLLNWMGIPDSDLSTMLPNLSNFDKKNLGFLG